MTQQVMTKVYWVSHIQVEINIANLIHTLTEKSQIKLIEIILKLMKVQINQSVMRTVAHLVKIHQNTMTMNSIQ